ncbi:flagellar biosynthesis regulator FlaF [Desulfosarcina ovata]|uniref:Flagellar protein FlaF n=1 Tax=Desulfosarcina ovata subsp. ovata TaxID=2752305 RepID=A0A5K8A753_9BACT|nr:flagellar biosynthesis regulator FlaF [Desulfosarcina ovata]BBO88309.1 flagellar protein FlaF [Desulfosarcina ovata subsp. ovata]
MYNNALKAYKSVERVSVSGRETEARVLTEAASKLRVCQRKWDNETRRTLLREALNYNQRIWSIFQTELGKADNPLPNHIKVDLLRLSGFVDKRIFEVMASPSPELLTILIKINENIAAGLRGQ